ncbi:MAG: urea carboxylase-associated family protein [Deltaproteobacteria bacterium]|nr:urea carboxylase-associated family protein [Deltaproteobacteria bacterium]
MERKKTTKPIVRYHLRPQTGTAFSIQKDHIIRVIDVEGEQVSDLICFSRKDNREVLSSGRTIDYNEKIYFSTGDSLYSNRSNPMLTIIDDPVGKHDFLFAPCSQDMFRLTYGVTETHPNCLDNLANSLRPLGINTAHIVSAFNIFMNTAVSEHGNITVKAPLSKAGDYIELQAAMDLIIGVTACAAGKCNNFRCTPIDVEVYEKRAQIRNDKKTC